MTLKLLWIYKASSIAGVFFFPRLRLVRLLLSFQITYRKDREGRQSRVGWLLKGSVHSSVGIHHEPKSRGFDTSSSGTAIGFAHFLLSTHLLESHLFLDLLGRYVMLIDFMGSIMVCAGYK